MLSHNFISHIQSEVLRVSNGLRYSVSDWAPNSHADLLQSPTLVVWSGASDKTIYQDPKINYAFRAWHDAMHLKTGLSFSIDHEIELGRRSASLFNSDLMQVLAYSEIAGQAIHFATTGEFPVDQVLFALNDVNKAKVLRK